jgi:hypothetical protein
MSVVEGLKIESMRCAVVVGEDQFGLAEYSAALISAVPGNGIEKLGLA